MGTFALITSSAVVPVDEDSDRQRCERDQTEPIANDSPSDENARHPGATSLCNRTLNPCLHCKKHHRIY
jgi:hypothetical protein